MAIALSSLGVRVYYGVIDETKINDKENTVDISEVDPFIEIPEVKSIPSLSPAPDTLETTPLANTEYKTYINGLKDLGGALEFTANLTQELIDMWNKTEQDSSFTTAKTVMGKFEGLSTEEGKGKELLLCIVHPKLTNAVYFPFEPASIGLPEITVNSVLEATLAITPIGEVVWGTKPTEDKLKTFAEATAE